MLELSLKAGEEGRVLAGHPWVFSNEVAEVQGSPSPGDLAVARSSRGLVLGLGFYNPKSLIAWRRLASDGEEPDLVPEPKPGALEAFLYKRLEEALEYRRRLYPGSESFRLAFGESDGLPGLVVDKYADHLAVQVLSAGMERLLPEIGRVLEKLLQPKGVHLKNDHPSRALEGLGSECKILSGEVPPKTIIEEGGLRFAVSLSEGQKTGFYFDQRENRAFCADHFGARKVLDLFCHSGGFSLTAARSGAEEVFGVDSSGPALELARESAGLNGLEERCRFDEGDALEALQDTPLGRFDFIVLDPPSYAPSKKHLPKAARAYVQLNALALGRLKGGGLLATSTCSHHIGRETFLEVLRESAARARKTVVVRALRGQGQDHPVLLSMPETEYLHFALLEVV